MIRVGLPKGRGIAGTRRICQVLGAEIMPGVLRYETDVCGAPVGIYLMKAPDIARLLRQNVLDLGLTGDDWLMEHDVARQRWCLEVSSYTASICLLMARDDARALGLVRSVVTPYPALARSLLGEVMPGVRIVAVAGSSEGLAPDLGESCLDLVETGRTAALNGLVVRRRFGVVSMHLARSEKSAAGLVERVVGRLAGARAAVS